MPAGNIQRFNLAIADDAKPLADKARAGACIENRCAAGWHMPGQQGQADARVPVTGHGHFCVIGAGPAIIQPGHLFGGGCLVYRAKRAFVPVSGQSQSPDIDLPARA
jgi:hypothetical protein